MGNPSNTAPVEIIQVDFAHVRHAEDLLRLLNEYAQDPMGGAEALPEHTRSQLITQLQRMPTAVSFLAYIDDRAVALANCFLGLSTFAARPLLNVHDFFVSAQVRGQGVASTLLAAIEAHAVDQGCCKLTLEVLSNNTPAKKVYRRFGFANYQLTDAAGQAEFWQKALCK